MDNYSLDGRGISFVDKEGIKRVGTINLKMDRKVSIIYDRPEMDGEIRSTDEYTLSELELLERLGRDSSDWRLIED